jgi:hypothetical protein
MAAVRDSRACAASLLRHSKRLIDVTDVQGICSDLVDAEMIERSRMQ